MKTKISIRSGLKGVGFTVTAAALFSSAYLVFTNETSGLATSTSFFWFSCFACLASWIIFRPKQKWSQSIKQGGYKWLTADIFLYFCSFSFSLTALKQQQAGTALTVVVVMILRAPITTIIGYFVAKDACQRWTAYWIGTIFILVGLTFYRLDVLRDWKINSMDTVTVFSLLATFFSATDATIRKRYRNAFRIDPANAIRSTFSAVVFLSFCWTMIDVSTNNVTFWPSQKEWLALAYLGIVPTTIANVLFNKAEDILSIPITQSINCLGPFFTLIVGLIPLPFFAMSYQHLAFRHYLGLILTVIGAIIVTVLAGVKQRSTIVSPS